MKKSTKFQKDAHSTIKGFAEKLESIGAKIEPATPTDLPPLPDAPWDGKKRLGAPTKSLRVNLTPEELVERRLELEKRLAQTPYLRDQLNATKDAAKAAKDRLSAHTADAEGYSAITKQGFEFREIECIEVIEKRAGGHILVVTYRTDTLEEVGPGREATSAELQENIGGV